MNSELVIGFGAVALVIVGLLVWLSTSIKKLGPKGQGLVGDVPEKAAETIFNNEFREELRNRGRLHFEKIINESAAFLQQDLRLTASQLSENIKNVMASKLQEEITNYEQSVVQAKNTAIEAIKKTNVAIDAQRKAMSQQVQTEIDAEKARAIKQLEQNMADVLHHYVLDVIGHQINLSSQIESILAELEKHKQSIVEDLKHE